MRKKVFFFLDGSLNFLAVFLVGLVFDEKHDRVYAKKPAHAQNKVWDGSAPSVKVAFVMEIAHSSHCNRLKSANRLLPNFYLPRSNMRLAKAPRVVPVESNFPFIVPPYVLYVTASTRFCLDSVYAKKAWQDSRQAWQGPCVYEAFLCVKTVEKGWYRSKRSESWFVRLS